MKKYNVFDAPLKINGIPFVYEKNKLQRLGDEVVRKVDSLNFLGRRCPGATVGFRTDSEKLVIRGEFESISPDVAMSRYSCQSVSVMIGDRKESVLSGVIHPISYEVTAFEGQVVKAGEMQEVTLHLPRNEVITNLEIYVDDDASVFAPTPFVYEKPVVFYGSSITEGGHASNVINAYTALLSRWLDFEPVCFGFSGSAKGETEIAEYINKIDMGAFVYDYDHNAPTPEFLEKTHEPFFRIIRENNPDLPVIMMTRPLAVYDDDAKLRRNIVRKTYLNAVEAGDTNVWFIDGEEFYSSSDRQLCSTDGTHPNDLGFYRMAKVIRPVLENALEKSKT